MLIRTVHYASCLMLFGVWAFERIVLASLHDAAGTLAPPRRDRMLWSSLWLLLPVALVSGAIWLVLVAAAMSGLPVSQVVRPQTLALVWRQTAFGTAWHWHLGAWIAAGAFCGLALIRRWPARLQAALASCALVASGVLVGSLAWAGHGIEGSYGHRITDVLHLLSAGIWPVGLAPFLWMFGAARKMPPAEGRIFRQRLTQRFSALSAWTVLVLFATGLANSFFLIGSLSGLTQTAYGRWLMVKIVLFLTMVTLGATNLLRLKPRMTEAGDEADSAGRRIQVNCIAELAFAGAVLIIVGILGILPPG